MRVSDLFNTHVKEGEYFDDETRRIAHRAVENLGAQHVVLPRQFSTQSVECGPCRLHRGLLIDAVEHYLLSARAAIRSPSASASAIAASWWSGSTVPTRRSPSRLAPRF